jgi:nicotinamidase/pyrazinamidase
MKIKIYKDHTVSFDIDVENGFTSNCPQELPVKGGHEIVDECNKSATKAKFRYASKDAHPSNGAWTADLKHPQFSKVGLPNVDIHWNQHCVVGTFGFELLEGLPTMTEYDFFIYKGVERNLHPYSPIYHDLKKTISTGIIEKAEHDGVITFILNGLALNYCLGEGALDLAEAGFEVIINLSATRGIGTNKEIENYINMLKSKNIIIVNNANEIESI